MRDRKDNSMYGLYREYKDTLKNANKVLRERQETNRGIREKYKSPFKREDHVANVSDITNWNSMIRDLEEDMKLMEMYLDFDDRTLLHRDYNNMKSMIYNQNSYEGEIFADGIYDVSVPNVEDVVCNVELQNEITELIGQVLSDRQMKVVYMYYWKEMTQKEIAGELGIAQQNVSANLQSSLGLLKKCIDYDEIRDFMSF